VGERVIGIVITSKAVGDPGLIIKLTMVYGEGGREGCREGKDRGRGERRGVRRRV
jgi:hypothetical protein